MGRAAPPPCGGRHRSGSTCGVPGRYSQALHGRGDPRTAEGERRTAWPFADDAGVRGRRLDDRASANSDRALRQLECRQAPSRARPAPVRDPGGAARAACARSARSSGGRRPRVTSMPVRAPCPRSRCYWHTFGSLAEALREAGFDVPMGEERLERAVDQGARCRGRSADCRSSRTGPRPGGPTHRS